MNQTNNGNESFNAYKSYAYHYPNYPQSMYPIYNNARQQVPTQQHTQTQGMLPMQESYIENILRLNKGKQATVYMTFENNTEWNAKVFKGTVEAAGRDHIILSNPETDKRYLLLMIYLDYITFDEEINYSYPYNDSLKLQTYGPR